jgi:hypothetical protein
MEGAPVHSNGKPLAALDKDAPWVEKFRPKTLDEVAAHKEIVDTSAQRERHLPVAPVSVQSEARGWFAC